MAMQTTRQILYDGERNLVMQFTGLCDGSGGEILEKKVDVTEILPLGTRQLKVKKVRFSVNGGVLEVLWDDTVPKTFLMLEGPGFFDYDHIGGANSYADDNASGNILFTTYGFEAGSNYTVLIELVK